MERQRSPKIHSRTAPEGKSLAHLRSSLPAPCPLVRVWGRSTCSVEFVLQPSQRDPNGPHPTFQSAKFICFPKVERFRVTFCQFIKLGTYHNILKFIKEWRHPQSDCLPIFEFRFHFDRLYAKVHTDSPNSKGFTGFVVPKGGTNGT